MADTDTFDPIKQLQEKIASRKLKLLEWESGFKKRHLRPPTIQDIKNRPDVEMYYLKYNRLKKKLKEVQTLQPSPRRPVEFVHSPNHPRSPHNRFLRSQQQEQRTVNGIRPIPLKIPEEVIRSARNNNKQGMKKGKMLAIPTIKEGTEGDENEELDEQAFWLGITVPELREKIQDTGLHSQTKHEDDKRDSDTQKETLGVSATTTTTTTTTAVEDTLDDLFHALPGNENWANSEDLGPMAVYARQKLNANSANQSTASNSSSASSSSRSKRKTLGDEEMMEKRRKMKAMFEPYRPKPYDTLTTALAAERQAKRDRENEQQNDNKPLQLAAAITKVVGNMDDNDDFIVSRRTYAPVVKSRDTGLLRNNPERRARLREQLEAGTLGMPKTKSTPSTQDDDSAVVADTTDDSSIAAVNTTEMEGETFIPATVN